MKNIFLMLFCILACATITNAQATKNHKVKKARVHHSQKINNTGDSSKLSNRKIYNWKDGQKATPTGHVATPSNGSQYSALKKDTGILRRKEKE